MRDAIKSSEEDSGVSPPPLARVPSPREGVHHTTSADIAEYRADIKRRIERDAGFLEAQEAASRHQRESERRWCAAEGVARAYAPAADAARSGKARGGAKKRPAAGARRGDGGEAAAAIRAATRITALPAAGGLHVSEAFEDALHGALHGGADADLFHILYPVGNSAASVDDMRHAGVVAIFGTNAMRGDVPNFPFVYAMLELPLESLPAAAPARGAKRASAASPRRQRVSLPRAKTPAHGVALLVERGALTGPSVHAAAAAGTLDAVRFFEIFVQVVCAIWHAYVASNFTHYDLTAENVHLDALDGAERGGYIPYSAPIAGGRVAVRASHVARFAEHGFAHISVSNTDDKTVSFGFSAEGKARLVEYGIHRDRALPMTDVYRFLLSSAAAAPADGGVRAVCADLFEFFNVDEDLATVLKAQNDPVAGYYLPQTRHAKAYAFEDLFEHCKRVARRPAWKAEAAGAIVSADGGTAGQLAVWRGSAAGFEWAAQVAPCVPEPGPDLLAFFDTYVNMIASGDDEDLRAAKAYASAFSRGFRTGSSRFHQGVAALTARAAAARAALETEMLATASHPRVPATARAMTKRAEAGVVESVLRAHRIFTLFQRLALYRRVLRYCMSVYWKNGAPADVSAPFEECNKFLEDAIARFAASVSNVAVYAVVEATRFGDAAPRAPQDRLPNSAAHLRPAFETLSHAACELLETTPDNIRDKYSF